MARILPFFTQSQAYLLRGVVWLNTVAIQLKWQWGWSYPGRLGEQFIILNLKFTSFNARFIILKNEFIILIQNSSF